VKVWCAKTGWLIHTLRPHQTIDPLVRRVGQINDFSINLANTILATSSSDRTIRTWNLETFEQLSYINVGKQIMSMSISPSPDESNQCLIVPCRDAKTRVYLWDSHTKTYGQHPTAILDSGTLMKDSADHCSFNSTGTKFIVSLIYDLGWRTGWYRLSFPDKSHKQRFPY
jgi:WD40 repeat protein